MKEQDIIKGCIQKDRKSQRVFVDTYAPYLLGVCRRYIKDKETVKDCLQDSLVLILSKMEQYKEKGQFKAWIAKIAANECLQYIRRNKKHIYTEIDTINTPIVNENVSFKLEQSDVMKFLDTLPVKYRIAINMYIVEGYSHREIGIKLGITESSSRSLVTRGRQKINELFRIDNMRVIHRDENPKTIMGNVIRKTLK